MKFQLHKTAMAEILGVMALTAIVMTVLVTLQNANGPATGPADAVQAPVQSESVVTGFSKPIEEYAPAERTQYQITEEYPFHSVDFSAMDPRERERYQITEYYP